MGRGLRDSGRLLGVFWGVTCMIWVTGPLEACPVTAELCTGFVCTTDITLPRLEIWGGRGAQRPPRKHPPQRNPKS